MLAKTSPLLLLLSGKGRDVFFYDVFLLCFKRMSFFCVARGYFVAKRVSLLVAYDILATDTFVVYHAADCLCKHVGNRKLLHLCATL